MVPTSRAFDPDPLDPFAADPPTNLADARESREVARIIEREARRTNEGRVPNLPPIDETLEETMRNVAAAQQRRLMRDLELLSSMPADALGEGPLPMPEPTYTSNMPRRRRAGTLAAVPPPRPAPNGLAEVLQPDARVLHDSTKPGTDITVMTDQDRIAWLESKLEEARALLRQRTAEIEFIRQQVRLLYTKPWMPSASAVLEAVHPYPEMVSRNTEGQ